MGVWVEILLLGAFAGLLAGLLGVGGGLVIVPVLVLIFTAQGVADSVLVHLAVGTSLATIVFTSLSSMRAHHAHGAVLWPVVWRLAPGIVMGALLGATVAQALPGEMLRWVFAVFELYVAVQMTLAFTPKAHRVLPGPVGLFVAGNVMGGVSSLVGIGGGTLSVPYLLWCNVDVKKAIGTSAALGMPIALAASVGFVVTGWADPLLPELSVGFVYLPAFLGVVITSTVFAPLGAKWAHRLPAKRLKQVFAVFLYGLAGYMFWG